MKIEKIENRQLFFIITMMRTTVVLATVPVITTADAYQDAWASLLVTFGSTIIFLLIIGGLGIRFPQLTIIALSRKLLGKVGGGVVGLLVLWSFLHLAAIEVRIYSEMIRGGFLTETPLIFLISTLVVAAGVAAFAGIEVIGRIADLLFPFFLLMLAFSLGALFSDADFLNLQPVLTRGFGPVLRGSLTPIGIGAQLLVLGILIPHLTRPKKAIATTFWGLSAAFTILIVAVILTIGVLGPDEAARAVFPFFEGIRSLQISEFLERIEVLVIFTWGFTLFIAFSTFLYCGAQGTAQLFKLKDYRVIIPPMVAFWVVLSLHVAENTFELRSFLSWDAFGPYGISLVLLPFTLLWGAYLVKKMLGHKIEAKTGED